MGLQACIRFHSRIFSKVLVVKFSQVIFELDIEALGKLDPNMRAMLNAFIAIAEPTGDLFDFISPGKSFFLVGKWKLNVVATEKKQFGKVPDFDAQRDGQVVSPELFLVI